MRHPQHMGSDWEQDRLEVPMKALDIAVGADKWQQNPASRGVLRATQR